MVCGAPATSGVSKAFEYRPESAGFLILPASCQGLIADHYVKKEMRVAGLPLCSRHESHWRALYWTAGVGWILVPALAGLALLLISVLGDPSNLYFNISLGVGGLLR